MTPARSVPQPAVGATADPPLAQPPTSDAAMPGEPAGAKPRPTRASHRRTLAEIPLVIAFGLGMVILVRLFLVQAFYIPSGSMLPQLQLQDKVLVSRLAYRLHHPHRGDILVFNAPPNAEPEKVAPHGGGLLRRLGRFVGQRLGLTPSTDAFIKRVIALPGETVEGRDGHVYVDGHLLLEPYLPPGVQTSTFAPVKVPSGRLWVMGDSRNNSDDSRAFGPIPRRTVIGRAFIRVWPMTHLAFL